MKMLRLEAQDSRAQARHKTANWHCIKQIRGKSKKKHSATLLSQASDEKDMLQYNTQKRKCPAEEINFQVVRYVQYFDILNFIEKRKCTTKVRTARCIVARIVMQHIFAVSDIRLVIMYALNIVIRIPDAAAGMCCGGPRRARNQKWQH